MDSTLNARLKRAQNSLDGLSVGDAFGEGFFMSWEMAARLIEKGDMFGPPYDMSDDFVLRELIDVRRTDSHKTPWRWTDDTALALEIVAELEANGAIDPDSLARRFSRRYNAQPFRGYGGAMHSLLPRLEREDWREASPNLFNGTGSYGNGAAMRGAPIGAYFADDLEACIANAKNAALVTHAHPEGVVGGVAVALAAAYAVRSSEREEPFTRPEFCELVGQHLEESEVKKRIFEARDLPEDTTGEQAAMILGSGDAIAAQDTVAFCVFCAGEFLPYYEEALWLTVSGLGDRDTTCAIVGGIVGAGVGVEGIPAEWLANREALDFLA